MEKQYKYTIIVTDSRHTDYEIEKEILSEIGAEVKELNCRTEDEMVAGCADADALLLDMAPCSRRVIESLHRCQIISRYGVGYDNVDVSAATENGILVTNVPDYCKEDVSDHALALMLSCLRHVAMRDRNIRAGSWNIQAHSYRLAGKTLGVLGFGCIARALVHKCSGFGLNRVLAYDPYLSESVCKENGAEKADLQTVLSEADFVSLHMPATPETKGIINAQTLCWMKKTAILINTARGSLIDDEALIDALKNHRILAAGLDTHNEEPLSKNSRYFTLNNVTLTDHTAYNTIEGVAELKEKAAQNIVDALLGKTPKYLVNQFPKGE